MEVINTPTRPSIGRAAISLAMTDNREDEEREKDRLVSLGYSVVATEVTGPLAEFRQKIIKSAVTAATNTRVIKATAKEHHGLVHAIVEAMQGVMISHLANPSLKMKVAVVSDEEWVAVAIFGVAALNLYTNHERCGLGVMHL
jgi:hut operon positive regulator